MIAIVCMRCHLPSCLQTEDESATTLAKKEEPDEKPEPMEVEEKKPEIKAEPKEEEEGGANSTTSSSPSQSRRKSEFVATRLIKKNVHKVYENQVLLRGGF